MRRIRVSLLVALLLIGLSTLGWAAKKQQAVVSGQVHVASADAKGNVLTVEILVADNTSAEPEPYLVAEVKPGSLKPTLKAARVEQILQKSKQQVEELKKQVGQWVVAVGTVTEDDLGWKTLELETYRLVDEDKPAPNP